MVPHGAVLEMLLHLKIFALTNPPQKLDNSTLKYPKFSYFQVRWYLLLPQNILFFADLHELEQVKKIVKMTKNFSIPYPPLQCEISPILFHCVGLLTISFILIITNQCYMGNIYIWWSFMFTFQRIHIVLTILLMRSPFSMDILFYDHHRPMLHCWDYNLNKLHILLAIFSFIL